MKKSDLLTRFKAAWTIDTTKPSWDFVKTYVLPIYPISCFLFVLAGFKHGWF